MTAPQPPQPLPAWPRPHFRAGGGDALLFYAVYAPTPDGFSISRSKYLCDGIPPGVDLMSYGPAVNPEVVSGFREGYVWEQFARESPALAAQVLAQPECIVIRGTIVDPENLNYFRNVIGLVTWLLDSSGVAVYDPQQLRWWEPARWRAAVFDPQSPSPAQHTVILVSAEDDGGEWLHTRGMRQFGRPDLSLHGVKPELRGAVVDLFNRLIEFQALGGIVEEGRAVQMQGLPAGLVCHHRGDHEDPDFNNVHVEISQAGSP